MVAPTKTARSLEARLRFRPKPYDIDLTGVIGNTVIVKWMEDLRVEMMDRHLPKVDVTHPENQSLIYRTEIRYQRPIHYNDLVLGRVWLRKMMRVKWIVEFEFVLENSLLETVVKALQWGAFIEYENGKPIAVPEAFLEVARKQVPPCFESASVNEV